MENFYVFINFAIPIVLLIFMVKLLFFSENYKKIRLTGTTFKKIYSFVLRFLAVILTALISWIILVMIGFSTGIYSMSTYGTPIYRPKVKI